MATTIAMTIRAAASLLAETLTCPLPSLLSSADRRWRQANDRVSPASVGVARGVPADAKRKPPLQTP
jgi:hypothetical protein